MRTIKPALLAASFALVACGGGSKPVPAQPAPPPAELRVGDVNILASVVRTSHIAESVAREYGIPHDENTWMLLVTLRRGAEGQDTSVPAQVEARALTLEGAPVEIRMREQRTANAYVDYLGTFVANNRDTLRFTVRVTPQGLPTQTMTFAHEIAP